MQLEHNMETLRPWARCLDCYPYSWGTGIPLRGGALLPCSCSCTPSGTDGSEHPGSHQTIIDDDKRRVMLEELLSDASRADVLDAIQSVWGQQ